jgi:hypothetical protein
MALRVVPKEQWEVYIDRLCALEERNEQIGYETSIFGPGDVELEEADVFPPSEQRSDPLRIGGITGVSQLHLV